MYNVLIPISYWQYLTYNSSLTIQVTKPTHVLFIYVIVIPVLIPLSPDSVHEDHGAVQNSTVYCNSIGGSKYPVLGS